MTMHLTEPGTVPPAPSPTTRCGGARAVIYQVYVRSFADGNGDGTGDLARRAQPARLPEGPRRRRASGSTPGTRRPLADGGYDVADYRDIHPQFGTLAEAEAAHQRGARARHPHDHRRRPEPHLDQHPWFQAALAAGPGSARARALLVPPRQGRRRRRDPDALGLELPGRHLDAHRRTPTARRGSGTCTCSRPSSPTSTGTTPTCAPSTRTSCGSGSTAASPACASTRPALLIKDADAARGRREAGPPASTPPRTATSCTTSTAHGGAIADSYPGTRVLVGEIWVPDIERFAAYLRPDEMHTAFNFDFLARPWDARQPAATRST